MQILFAIDMYVCIYILKHVFSIGNKSNVQLKPTNINVLYLDYYSKLLMPSGIHHAFILGYQYICHKKFCFCHFIAEGEFKWKKDYFFFKASRWQNCIATQYCTFLYNFSDIFKITLFCYFYYLFYSHIVKVFTAFQGHHVHFLCVF